MTGNQILWGGGKKGKGETTEVSRKKNEKNSYHGEVCFSPMVKI